MLRNRQGQKVVVASSFQFGVDYNPKTNEFEGSKAHVREYDNARRDLRESKGPVPFPKGNMFSIEMRARIHG